MNAAAEIEREKLALLVGLEADFGMTPTDAIGVLVAAFDQILREKIEQCLIRHAAEIFASERADVDRRSLYVKGVRFEIEMLPNIHDPKSLLVCLIPRDAGLEGSQLKLETAVEVDIGGYGEFSKVVFEVPRLITAMDRDFLAGLTQGLFVAGNNWIYERALKSVRELSEEANQSLYRYMRTVVANQEVMNGFVFLALLDGSDFVVLDEGATSAAIKLASRDSWKVGRSPLDTAIQVMTQVVPDRESLVVDVVGYAKSTDFDLATTKYYHEDVSLFDALRAIWGEFVSIFPIVREGKMLLVAVFRTEFKSELEPILLVHAARLEEIAKEKIGRMRRMLRRLMQNRGADWPGAVGKFAGAFAASFLKTLQHHG
ncbi:MAG TPA: hypothetical protein VFS60_12160 [Thermoanaerobaculia bacterium]|nr:hypothetical protein [Thermoanaerobaculia bacterium]